VAFGWHYCQKTIKTWWLLVLYACMASSSQHFHSPLAAYYFLHAFCTCRR